MFSCLHLLFSTTPLEGSEQMALDEVLLREVSQPLLRVYCWKEPCVTFGYFQKQEMVEALYPGISLVRRWSGGGCVVHGEDLTFSLMLPASEELAAIAPALFYRKLHEKIVMALQQQGIPAHLATLEECRVGESCFTAPSPCDVMLAGKKIVGGAQRRSEGRLLYQGSLHLSETTSKTEDAKALELFSSLAEQLSSHVVLTQEKSAWITAAHHLAQERYQLASWLKKR